MTSSNQGDDDTIRVKRRRPAGPSDSGPRERAEAPQRQRPDEGGAGEPAGGGTGGRPTGGAGSGSSGGFGLPPVFSGRGGKGGAASPLLIGVIIVAMILFFILRSCGGSEQPVDTGYQPETLAPGEPALPAVEPTQPAVVPTRPRATATRKAAASPVAPPTTSAQGTPAPAASSTGQKWTVMLYQDADDKVLEQDIYFDLNEAERVGSTDQVQIVAQMDRFRSGFSGDGNWTGAKRFFVTQDNDLSRVRSEQIADLGEVNMSDSKNLIDFVTWAMKEYPADKYALILSDHGMGWPGGMSDADPAVKDPSRAPLVSAISSDQLYTMELYKTLANAVQKTSLGKFEMIGLDACLMSQIEVISALEPYARYAVLSQETEPSLGWAYTSFLQALVDNPDMGGAELSQIIVSSYIKDDQRINDDQARADFLRQGSPMGGLFGSANQTSATTLAKQLERDVTLTAVDLSSIPDLINSINNLAYNLQSENQGIIASARTYAPAFTNVFGKDTPSPYIDLGGFVQMLKRQGANSNTSQAADQVLSSIQGAVIAEKHGSGQAGATGISIYFPISDLYRSSIAGPQSYGVIAQHFAEISLWDDFLAYHYNEVGFKSEPIAPVTSQPTGPSRAPGLGQIQVSAITLSGSTASPSNPVTLTAQVSGTNIGYIYLFVGYYDQASNSIFEADTDYLESPNTQQLNGVYYPVWNGDQPFTLTLDWNPTLFQISDGTHTSVALFTPKIYGASAQDAVYTVDGIYHYADGTSLSARLYFRDGVMQQVFGYTEQNETGSTREIIPQAGDTFTILEKWLDLDTNGQVTQSVTQEGTVLTFGSQTFTWKEVYAGAGDYMVGFIIEDMDGNSQEVYTTVTVQ